LIAKKYSKVTVSAIENMDRFSYVYLFLKSFPDEQVWGRLHAIAEGCCCKRAFSYWKVLFGKSGNLCQPKGGTHYWYLPDVF
jgi:hypothetical protein